MLQLLDELLRKVLIKNVTWLAASSDAATNLQGKRAARSGI